MGEDTNGAVFEMKPYQELAIEIATLTEWEEIPLDARNELDTIDALCKNAGGRLFSRQVIAMVLAPYIEQMENQ